MHMIRLYIQFHNFAVYLLGKHPDVNLCLNTNFSVQYTITIFGNPDEMILAMP